MKSVRETDLERTTYCFSYRESEHSLVLSWLRIERRKSKRHKFRAAGEWDRVFERDSSIQRDQISVPADALDEARRTFCETLKVDA